MRNNEIGCAVLLVVVANLAFYGFLIAGGAYIVKLVLGL